MRKLQFVFLAVVVGMYIILVSGDLPPRGQLPNPGRMEQMIHLGLFPDKPLNMTFLDYFRKFTVVNENLTKVLERLEFNVLDAENLENVIKLAEDAKKLKELKAASARAAEESQLKKPSPQGRRMEEGGKPNLRQRYKPQEVFHYSNFQNAWTVETRQKVLQFMQHSVYSTKYEINKLRNLRKKYENSTVFKIGMIYGNQMELKVTAGALLSTMMSMPLNVSMLWYLFHYHKLLNIAYDVGSNTEQIYLFNKQIMDGNLHEDWYRGKKGAFSMPANSEEATSKDPEALGLGKKKKKK